MTIVSTDFLAALMTNFKVIYKTAFDAADAAALYKKIVTVFPSNTDKETYAWLGTVPKMREWVDERVFEGLLGHDFSIKNKHFEVSMDVDRDTLEDDKYGMITPRIQQLADEAARYPDELVFLLWDDGALGVLGKAFDDAVYFKADREIGGSGVINNIVAGAYSASAEVIRTGIGLAVQQMKMFKDDKGRVMNLQPDTLLCSPTMEIAVRNALLPGVAGTTRPETAWVKNILVHPGLTSGTGKDYYLACTGKPLKSVFFQNRKSPEFVSMDKPDSPEVFMRRRLLYGVDARYNVGWGDPRYAVMVNCDD